MYHDLFFNDEPIICYIAVKVRVKQFSFFSTYIICFGPDAQCKILKQNAATTAATSLQTRHVRPSVDGTDVSFRCFLLSYLTVCSLILLKYEIGIKLYIHYSDPNVNFPTKSITKVWRSSILRLMYILILVNDRYSKNYYRPIPIIGQNDRYYRPIISGVIGRFWA